MALSNIFREPRREITESVVGILFSVGMLWIAYAIGRLLGFPEVMTPGSSGQTIAASVFGMMVGAIIMAICVGLLFLTHAIGDGICNSLARRGLELRPKQRYR